MRHLIIGGIAFILHGVPRATFGLDILIETSLDNAQRLLQALLDGGMATAFLTTAEDVLANEIAVFKDRARIDVLTCAPGIEFKKAWLNRETMEYQGQEFFVLSKKDLIVSKRESGRDIDIEDVRLLELTPEE